MSNTFPHGIEVVAAGLIRNNEGEIFLTKSPKWSGKWCIPGGHVEIGESFIDATIREIKEETKLVVTYISLLHCGEMINPPDFHRPAHFIYFTSLLTTNQKDPKLDNEELVEYQWLTPQDALELPLAEPNDIIIHKYLELLAISDGR